MLYPHDDHHEYPPPARLRPPPSPPRRQQQRLPHIAMLSSLHTPSPLGAPPKGTLTPSLSPSHKAILASSRSSYLSTLPTLPSSSLSTPTRLRVGVCVFRISVSTGEALVLLLRRRGTARPSGGGGGVGRTAGGREAAGRWELPGGPVRDADYSISGALAARAHAAANLRVARVLGALPATRCVAETRVLEWWARGEGDGGEEEDDGRRWALRDSGVGMGMGTGMVGGRRSVMRRDVCQAVKDAEVEEDEDEEDDQEEEKGMVLRKRIVQLNYAVLVECTDDAVLLSKEHDQMLWVSMREVEGLRMKPELRLVVKRGLAWASQYLY
ncbi:hypothetical protein F4780DRAFT_790878 [Xylariomycetidae sp. FL0641]|nr:hypothetical protein F4780DRAFT_790878 [Xylariomycetidae sp. FL0641]